MILLTVTAFRANPLSAAEAPVPAQCKPCGELCLNFFPKEGGNGGEVSHWTVTRASDGSKIAGSIAGVRMEGHWSRGCSRLALIYHWPDGSRSAIVDVESGQVRDPGKLVSWPSNFRWDGRQAEARNWLSDRAVILSLRGMAEGTGGLALKSYLIWPEGPPTELPDSSDPGSFRLFDGTYQGARVHCEPLLEGQVEEHCYVAYSADESMNFLGAPDNPVVPLTLIRGPFADFKVVQSDDGRRTEFLQVLTDPVGAAGEGVAVPEPQTVLLRYYFQEPGRRYVKVSKTAEAVWERGLPFPEIAAFPAAKDAQAGTEVFRTTCKGWTLVQHQPDLSERKGTWEVQAASGGEAVLKGRWEQGFAFQWSGDCMSLAIEEGDSPRVRGAVIHRLTGGRKIWTLDLLRPSTPPGAELRIRRDQTHSWLDDRCLWVTTFVSYLRPGADQLEQLAEDWVIHIDGRFKRQKVERPHGLRPTPFE